MSKLSKAILKTFFETGDFPTQGQFAAFIDSSLNLLDDRKLLGLKVYSPTTGYEIGDTAIYNSAVYIAIAPATGTFDTAKWQQLTFSVGGYTSQAGITAYAGGGQSQAFQLTSEYNKLDTVATAGDSVKVSQASANKRHVIVNNGANDCAVFPVASENFEGLPANAAVSLSAGMSMEVFCFTNGTWVIID
jgi:hypothetical protein